MRISRMQTKIMALVAAVLVVGFGTLVYKSAQNQADSLIEADYAKMDLLASSVITSVKAVMHASRPEAAQELVTGLREVKGVEQIRVFGKDAEELFVSAAYAPSGPRTIEGVKAALGAGGDRKVREDRMLTLLKPIPNTQDCVGCHDASLKMLGVVSVSVSLEKAEEEIRNVWVMGSLNALAVILAVLAVIYMFLQKMVLGRVGRAVLVMEEMQREKDLTRRMGEKWKDEMGRLGRGFNSFVESVQKVLQRINRVSYQVSSASTQIVVNSARVVEGAQIQVRSVESTSSAVDQMNASIKEVAGSANILYSSAETTSSSIIEMNASMQQINKSTAALSGSVESTVSSISEISASIKEVSTSVGVLSDAVRSGVESMERIAVLIGKVEGAARDSAELTERVTADAKELGAGAMARAIEGMDRIRAAVDRSGEVINRLGSRSKQIGDILDIIDEVADQTELLSLNAAILASQAGEHGKGFAVVAEEIKDLAERTASSTNEISKLIAAVQAESSEAVDAMDTGRRAVEEGQAVVHEAKDVLEKIVASSIKSSRMSKEIEASTAEQSEGASQVGVSMINIRDMVTHILKATQELTEGSEHILREADRVRDVSGQVHAATEEQARGSQLILKAVENVNVQARHIASATAEHQKGSQEIARSIEKIHDVARENETLAGEMGLAVEELAKHTEELKGRVSSFRVSVSGSEMIKFGLVPLESPAQMYRKFYPLAEYLSKEIGREVVFKLTPSFADAVTDLGTGVSDICYMTPTTYIDAKDRYGVSLLAKAVRKGLPFSHTIIVARADSPVERLEDLKGKKFAFGDKMSTSSYMVPLYMLSKAGVRLEDLEEHRFLGHHDDVAKAVLLGEFDAGGLRETTAYQYRDRDRGLKFLKVSDSIPEFNVCARPGLDPELAGKVKAALLALDAGAPEKAKVLKSIDSDYTGFMEARDSDYSAIREMVSNLLRTVEKEVRA